MIKAIANKKISLTKEEYEYYLELEKNFGSDAFLGLFNTDTDGYITSITPSPTQPTAMLLIFFLLNLMLNQKLRKLDISAARIDKMEARLAELEKRNEK